MVPSAARTCGCGAARAGARKGHTCRTQTGTTQQRATRRASTRPAYGANLQRHVIVIETVAHAAPGASVHKPRGHRDGCEVVDPVSDRRRHRAAEHDNRVCVRPGTESSGTFSAPPPPPPPPPPPHVERAFEKCVRTVLPPPPTHNTYTRTVHVPCWSRGTVPAGCRGMGPARVRTRMGHGGRTRTRMHVPQHYAPKRDRQRRA